MEKTTTRCEKVDAKAVYYFISNYNAGVRTYNRYHSEDEQLDTLVWADVVAKINKIDEATEAELSVIINAALKKFYDALDNSDFESIMVKATDAVDLNELF